MEKADAIALSLTDMVFEYRNKAYGAYQLRQSYDHYLRRATLAGCTGFLVFLAFLWYSFRYAPEAVVPLIQTTAEPTIIGEPLVLSENTGGTGFLEEEKKEEIFFQVEQMPQFEGGLAALGKYLSKHLRYPAAARDRGVAGLVYVQFVVDSRGQVSDVKVLKGIDTACDEEAARVVSQMPAWKPGRQNGRNVSVRFSLPIRFSVENQ